MLGIFILVLVKTKKKKFKKKGKRLCILGTAPSAVLRDSARSIRGAKLKSEPKSSMTEEGNLKPNPWLPAATTHISSGSNDS